MIRNLSLAMLVGSLCLASTVRAQSDGGLSDASSPDAAPTILDLSDAALQEDPAVGDASLDAAPADASSEAVDATIASPDAEASEIEDSSVETPAPTLSEEITDPGESDSPEETFAPEPNQTADPSSAVVESEPEPADSSNTSPSPRLSPAQPVTPLAPNFGDESWGELLPELPALEGRSVWNLFLSLALVLALLWLIRLLRDRLPARGFIPRSLSVLSLCFRVALAVIAFLILMQLVPEWMDPVMKWILIAAAAALGWSARDVLPDLLAGVILGLERRVRVGVWVSGDGFGGLVESRGPRAVHIRDAHGHTIAIPNRILLEKPTLTDVGIGVGHEIVLRLPTEAPAALVRHALRDAVLASPWVPPSVEPLVFRDTSDPERWHLRCRLLEPSHALHFEGEILERTEEIIAHIIATDD